MRISLLIVSASLGFLAACSGSPEAPASPPVASVDTGGATPVATPSKPPAAGERARFRIDMTDEERQRMYDPYLKCMADHGVAVRGRPATPNVDSSLKDKAKQDCDPLLPLPAWENDASNPEALDFNRDVVECLRGKGVKAEVKTGDQGTVGLSLGGGSADANSINAPDKSIDQAMKLADVCEKEVFARGHK